MAGFVPRVLLSALTAAMLIAASSAAQSIERLTLTQDAVIDFDAFDGLDGVATVSAEFDGEGLDGRRIALFFDPAGGADFDLQGPSDALPVLFQLSQAAAPNAKTLPVLAVDAVGEGPYRAAFQVRIPSGPVPEPGEYERVFDVTAVDAATGEALLESESLILRAVVASRAQVNIAGASGAFNPAMSVPFIDLGELHTGLSREVFVQVRSNADTRIVVTSENGGRLVHQEAPDMPPVDYAVELDGELSDLDQPLEIVRRPALSLAGTSYPMLIRVTDADGKAAGTYRDYILVEVIPQ